jgi:hypothetical protein
MKVVRYILDQAWTLAGTGLVLITLSGSTRTAGIWMSVAAVVLHFLSFVLPEDGGE